MILLVAVVLSALGYVLSPVESMNGVIDILGRLEIVVVYAVFGGVAIGIWEYQHKSFAEMRRAA